MIIRPVRKSAEARFLILFLLFLWRLVTILISIARQLLALLLGFRYDENSLGYNSE
jgi:hypothetical protein